MTQFPKGWRIATLKEIAKVKSGFAFKSVDWRDEGVPVVKIANVQAGYLTLDDAACVSEETRAAAKDFELQAGDIVMTLTGNVGRVARIGEKDLPLLLNQRVGRLSIDTNQIDINYLFLYLNNQTFRDKLQKKAKGVAQPNVSPKEIGDIEIIIPPLAEQQRIVEILEDHLSRLDAANRYLEKAVKMNSAYLTTLLSGLTVGKMTKLDEVAEIQGGIQKQAKRRPTKNKFPFLRVANVTADGLDLSEVHEVELFGNEIERYRLRKGDLLVVEGNGSPSQIGRAALWDGAILDTVHQNHLIRVRPNGSITADYLEIIWNSPQTREHLTQISSSSSGLNTLSVSKLRNLEIPIPTLNEQNNITNRAQDARELATRVECSAKEALVRSSSLRRALLAAAFSGKLTGLESDMDRIEESTDA